jgi:ABC-type dipeptide/oligopeptide/nickel transport system ATPase subunit
MLSSIDRISVGAKSPLTGGIKESNAGGRTGLQLTLLGIKALIVENAPIEPGWWIFHLRPDGARFVRADDLAGLGVYEGANILLKRFGDKVAIAMIGPGGEMGLSAAGIQNIDKDRTPSRINARGGLGAVMGAKRLKAIIIEAHDGQKPPIADLARFRRTQQAFNQALAAHPVVNSFTDYGTAGMTMITNAFGSLPTRNFSSGQFEGADRISGEFLRQSLIARGEAIAIVGESGCGKSSLMKTILGLYKPTKGKVVFDDEDLSGLGTKGLRWYRSHVGYVQQDPYGALTPFMTVQRILEEPLIIGGIRSKEERQQRIRKVMEEVKMFPIEDFLGKYPHMLSGGQQQRVVITRAMIMGPNFLVADEPVSMLDASVRVEILKLLRGLQKSYNLSVIYITHDLSTVSYFSERIFVM